MSDIEDQRKSSRMTEEQAVPFLRISAGAMHPATVPWPPVQPLASWPFLANHASFQPHTTPDGRSYGIQQQHNLRTADQHQRKSIVRSKCVAQ